MKPFFVTATGTDVGKTYVTAGIIRAARQANRPAGAIKPILSGYSQATAASSDAAILLDAMGKRVTLKSIAAIAPWRYFAPLSPDMAAAREGRSLHLPDVLTFCHAAIQSAPGLILVEGVGGAMVPLNATQTVRDWIFALNIPVLLVAGSYLGTISHSLATAAALSAQNIPIAAIVISESETSPVPLEETAAAIANFLPGIPTHLIPRHLNNISFANLAQFLEAF